MEPVVESIQNDLDLVRSALARASLPPSTTVTSGEANGGEQKRGWQAGPQSPQQHGGVTLDGDGIAGESEASVVPSVGELEALREQIAVLSAAELQRAKLEVQLAARDATIRHYAQSNQTLTVKGEHQQSELDQTSSVLKEAKAELVTWRERYQRLQREAQLLQQELEALVAQCDRLQCSVLELRALSQKAIDDNNALRQEVQTQREQCETLQRVQAALDSSAMREEALQREVQTLRNASAESEAYFTAAVSEIEARREYWVAMQQQHESLLVAYTEAQKATQMWEDRFSSEFTAAAFASAKVPTDAPADASSNLREESTPKTTVNEGSGSDDGSDEAETRPLLTALEAKIIDLALNLQEQRAKAEAAQGAYDTLAAAVERETCELVEARHALAVQRPEWKKLTEANTRLQASLFARESYVEALQGFVVTVLDDLTELTLHCYELETQLATPAAPMSAAHCGGISRRSTALGLLQSKSQRHQQAWHGTVQDGSKRSKGP